MAQRPRLIIAPLPVISPPLRLPPIAQRPEEDLDQDADAQLPDQRRVNPPVVTRENLHLFEETLATILA